MAESGAARIDGNRVRALLEEGRAPRGRVD